MKIQTAMVTLLIISMHANAQTTTTYYDQDGLPIGTAKAQQTATQQSWTSQPFTYRSDIPSFQLIQQGLASKQAETDRRKMLMQNGIEEIASNINRMFADYPNEGKELYNGISTLVRRLNEGAMLNPDITQDNVFEYLYGMIKEYDTKVYTTYGEVRQQAHNKQWNKDVQLNDRPTIKDIIALAQDKNYSEAIDKLNILINSTSDTEPYIEYRARLYAYGLMNFDKAIQDYTACIQMSPDSPKLYYARAVLLEHSNQTAEAIKDFTNCIQHDDNDLKAYFSRAVCKSQLGDYQGEENDYNVIISKWAVDSEQELGFLMATVYNNMGYSLFKRGKLKEALTWINRALETGKEESYIWSSRGEIYYHMGKYREAVNDLDQSIALNEAKKSVASSLGKNAGSLEYYLRGLAKMKLGKKGSGCQDLRTAGDLGNEDAFKEIKQKCQ